MAKTGCKVKIEWKGWKRGGYVEVMNGGGVQGMLDQKASAALSSANASFSPKPGEGAGYEGKTLNGSLAKGRIIYTTCPHANASERKHNRLQGIFGGGA